MAEEEKPTGQEGAEDKGGEDNKPASTPPVGSDDTNISPAEKARREAQSAKDKENSEGKDDLREDLDWLKARESERVRNEIVTDLLKDSDKYPNVKPDDPMFKYAGSKEEVEEIATTLQNKYTDMQQDALRSVQTESEQSLTDEEIAQKEDEMSKETEETGKSNFGNFLDNLGRRKKA